MMALNPRKTRVLIRIDSKDVSDYVAPDLLSFTYTDKETDEADEISVSLMDPYGYWAGKWCPEGGEKIVAGISAETTDGVQQGYLFCGTFQIDSLRASGSPRVMEMGGVSIPLEAPIRRKVRTRAWEKTTLKAIASEVASSASMTLLFDVEDDPSYDRVDQQRETDLAMLSRLCKDDGLSVKVTDEQLVIFDQQAYEKKEAAATIVLEGSDVISWDFSTQKGETYKSVTVSYRDPKQKTKGTSASYYNADFEKVTTKTAAPKTNPAVMTYTYTDPDADENGQEFQLKKRCKSVAEAEKLARAKLRELNKRSVTGSITLAGDTSLIAGMVVEIVGFGSWDGNFIISSARHEVSGSGYTTGLELRRVNTNY